MEYLPLDSELKKQTAIAKDQYKLFKEQISVINNTREDDGVKTEDDELIDDVHYKCISNEYQNSIDNIFKFGLMDADLHLTNFDKQQQGLTNIVNAYRREKILMCMINYLISTNT